jgi:CBS-domain-containing membrane protein
MKRFDPDILGSTQIKNIMNKQPATVLVDDELSQAHEKFSAEHVTHLVVIDSARQVVGLLSQKYLYKARSPRKIVSEEMEFRPDLLRDGGDSFYTKDMLDSYYLSKIMQKSPFTLAPEASLAEALLHMANKNLSCIPIVDAQKKILGVLTQREIIKFFADYCS